MLNCTLNNFTEILINPCNNEEIEFNLKLKDCHTDDFARINFMITGTGIGNLGNHYVYHTNFNQNIKNINLNPNEVIKIGQEIREIIIGSGDAPSFFVTLRYYFLVTPNGDITVTRDIVETKCK